MFTDDQLMAWLESFVVPDHQLDMLELLRNGIAGLHPDSTASTEQKVEYLNNLIYLLITYTIMRAGVEAGQTE